MTMNLKSIDCWARLCGSHHAEVYESYRTRQQDEHYDELLQLARSGEQTAEERWQTMAEAENTYWMD